VSTAVRADWRMVLGAVALTLVAGNVALSRLPSPVTGGSGQPLQELPAALAQYEPGDVLLVLTPDLTWALIELTDRPPAFGLPRGAWEGDPQANALFERALEGARRAWLLTYDPPPPSWYEERLREAGRLLDERRLEGYRLAVYALDVPTTRHRQGHGAPCPYLHGKVSGSVAASAPSSKRTRAPVSGSYSPTRSAYSPGGRSGGMLSACVWKKTSPVRH
jgi:hypothetical protein